MAEKSIVLELQLLAASETTDISELLRKALLVAEKLELTEFAAWIRKEISGYSGGEEIPDYREIRTRVKGVHAGLGLEAPITFDNEGLAKQILLVRIPDPISGIAEVLNSGNQIVEIALPPEWERRLSAEIDAFPVRYTSVNSFSSIIEAVKTEIMDVAIRLEKEGILGEGIIFSSEEKERAAGTTVFNIGSIDNLNGILGSVTDSVVHQHNVSIETGDISALREYLKTMDIHNDDLDELQSALEAEPALPENAVLGPKVRGWFAKMIDKAGSGAWKISIATAANLLAHAIYSYYGAIPPA